MGISVGVYGAGNKESAARCEGKSACAGGGEASQRDRYRFLEVIQEDFSYSILFLIDIGSEIVFIVGLERKRWLS